MPPAETTWQSTYCEIIYEMTQSTLVSLTAYPKSGVRVKTTFQAVVKPTQLRKLGLVVHVTSA